MAFRRLMAPTEILTNQHFIGLSELAEKLNLNIKLLTGSVKLLLENHSRRTENASLQILIGTHALLEDKVKFQILGLAVIDEQHRFGVEQRSKLWKKTKFHHVFW
jgi:ATP-dependent DNA helicase RecG